MAKNWKVGEAVEAIKAGNKADILDIGRRFPLFLSLAVQVNEAGVELLNCLPDYVTARKIESGLKGEVTETEDNEEVAEVEEVEEAPKAKAKAKPAAKEAPAPEKTAKELYAECLELGLKVKPKQDKAVYEKALAEAAKANNEEEEDWGEEEAEEEKPKAKAKAKPAAKEAPKAKAKAKAKEEVAEEDEDWDI